MCRGCGKVVKSGWQVVSQLALRVSCDTNPSMDALPANRSWPPSCSHDTYQHETITSRSRQLLMMGTWLPETCWVTSRREIKNTKVASSWFFLSTMKFLVWLRILQHLKMDFIMHLAFCVSKTHSVALPHVSINFTLAYRLYKYSGVSICSYAKALVTGSRTETAQ